MVRRGYASDVGVVSSQVGQKRFPNKSNMSLKSEEGTEEASGQGLAWEKTMFPTGSVPRDESHQN